MRLKKVFVAGHNGLVGRALIRALKKQKDVQLIVRDRTELDLRNSVEVHAFLEEERPDQVIMAAAKVGGIQSNNNFPANFIHDNLIIQTNIIHGSHLANIQKLLFLGSSCIYPKYAKQPIEETALLSGKLEKTNEAYAIAKIAGLKMCQAYNKQYNRDYRSIMPTNLFGPFDNFHPENSHVIPGLIRRIHEANIHNESSVTIWGSGKVKREFLHVDDLAKASLFLLDLETSVYDSKLHNEAPFVNVGSGYDLTIHDLASLICKVVNYKGKIVFDTSKPDGTPRKLLNIDIMKSFGWEPEISLEEGLVTTYNWYKNNEEIIKEN